MGNFPGIFPGIYKAWEFSEFSFFLKNEKIILIFLYSFCILSQILSLIVHMCIWVNGRFVERKFRRKEYFVFLSQYLKAFPYLVDMV